MRQVLKTAITRVQERSGEFNRDQKDSIPATAQPATAKSDAPAAAAADEKLREAEAAKRLEAEAHRRREAEAKEKLMAAEAEEARRQAAAEQQKQNELMQRQLREAEAQRLEVERKAEADRLVREKEEATRAAADTETSAAKVPDENLLEIPVAAEVVAYRDTAAVEEDELAAVLRELEEAEAHGQESAKHTSESKAQSVPDDVIVFDSPVDLGVQSAATEDDENIFTIEEKKGFSMPMPAIAGVITILVVIAVGAWFLMSGSPEPVKPQAVPTVEVTQPAPVAETPAVETVAASQSDTNSLTADAPAEQAASAAKAAATPKPKKETAKAAPDKKKVTVDDLINDN